MLWRLLRTHISASQLIGFSLANLVGLTIVILAVQFYRDVQPVFDDDESFIRKDYLVITRNVTSAGAMMGGTSEFSDQDIADIEAQPWCRAVGRFTSSEFAINATVGLADSGRALRSQFFFESIPDDFIDVTDAQWSFDPARPEVPVIVSRDYLSLYNFGFAATQGLPRISEGQVGMIPLMFTFSGNGRNEVVPGRIVGFSNRLNTVIVPDEFMRWANDRYGQGNVTRPLRLIIEVNSPGDVAIEDYMTQHRYDVAGDKMNSSKANYFLTVIVSVVIAVGIVISLLSFFVLMLSIYLLLQKNTRKLQDLLLLGYSPQQVARPYMLLVLAINAAVLVLAVVLMLLARLWYLPMLHAFGVAGASVMPAIAVGLVIMALITAGNLLAIRRKVAALWLQ
ncbi:MAG: ABC transporter permease [Muribaculaceae bacterium]|nr:ABC transporter permease [Muribaculaceae bacterium]MBR1725342.1 ABC transporter permease [Muribaculaceae bacterium]